MFRIFSNVQNLFSQCLEFSVMFRICSIYVQTLFRISSTKTGLFRISWLCSACSTIRIVLLFLFCCCHLTTCTNISYNPKILILLFPFYILVHFCMLCDINSSFFLKLYFYCSSANFLILFYNFFLIWYIFWLYSCCSICSVNMFNKMFN